MSRFDDRAAETARIRPIQDRFAARYDDSIDFMERSEHSGRIASGC